MTFDEFQKQASKSIAIPDHSVVALAHRTLGLTGEAGEAANMVKKIIRDRSGKATPEDIAALKEKLGDTLYYVAVLAEYFDLNLSDVADAAITKSQAFAKNRQLK